MVMMPAVVFSGLAIVVAVTWSLIVACQLRAIPRVIPLCVLIACWVGSYGLGSAAFATWVEGGGWDRLTIVTGNHVVLMLGAAALAIFTVLMPVPAPAGADEDMRRAWVVDQQWWSRRSMLILLPGTCVLVGLMVVTAVVTPPELRDRLAAMASGDLAGAPVGSSHVGMFFFAENAHLFLTFCAVLAWATLHLRRRDVVTPLRWGLRVLWVGAGLYAAGAVSLTVSGMIRWAGTVPTPVFGIGGMGLLGAGYVLVLLGVVLPMLINVMTVAVVVCRQLRDWNALRPLWNELREVRVPLGVDVTAPQKDDGPERK